MPKDTFFNLPDEKRQVITDLAIEEFSSKPYKNVSISRIVERAGIAKGSFYQYFENKKDLYLYLIQLTVEEKTAFLQSVPPPPDGNIFQHLRWMVDAGLNFEFSNPRLAQIGYRALYDDVPLPDETLATIRKGSLAYFSTLVEGGIQSGDFDPDIDPGVAAFVFNAIFTNLGEFVMDRQDISPQDLLHGGPKAMDSAGLKATMDQVMTILERALSVQKEPIGDNQ